MIHLGTGPHLGASDAARTPISTARLCISALGLAFSLSSPALAGAQTGASAVVLTEYAKR